MGSKTHGGSKKNLLGVDPKAELAVITKAKTLPQFDAGFGKELVDAYLPVPLQQSIRQSLSTGSEQLVVCHDRASATIPWEVAFLQQQGLALVNGVSRRFCLDENSSIVQGAARSKLTSGKPLSLLMLLNPNHPEAHFQLGWALLLLGRRNEAIAHFRLVGRYPAGWAS